MSSLAAVIFGIAALVSGEWRYALLSFALAVALVVTDNLSNDSLEWRFIPGGLSILLVAATIGIVALLDSEWIVAIGAGLVILASLVFASGGIELKVTALIVAVVLTLLLMAPAKVLIILVAATLAIPLLLVAATSQDSGSTGCFPALAAIGIVLIAVYLWGKVEEKEREKLVERYGTAVFDLCANPAELPTASSAIPGSRVLFVESGQGNRGKVMEDYSSKIPDRYRAHNQAEVGEVICIAPGQEVYGTGSYTNRATCTRYQRSVHAYAVNLADGTVIADQVFYGDTPSSCPSTTRQSSIAMTGDGPSSGAVVNWALSLVQAGAGS